MNSPLKDKRKEVYRKREIAENFNISIGTVNNRIKDGTFTKIILNGNSRLVYIKCEEVDKYFRGEVIVKQNDASIVTPHMKQKIKLVPTKKREAIEVLLKRIEDIENDLDFNIDDEIDFGEEDFKKEKKVQIKKAPRRKRKKVSVCEDESFKNNMIGANTQKKKVPRRKNGTYNTDSKTSNQISKGSKGFSRNTNIELGKGAKSGGSKIIGRHKMSNRKNRTGDR